MAFEVSSRSGVRSQVNITPLIDVVLVLLIIFMVMVPTTMKHMKPQLARESAEPAPPGTQAVLVELTATGVTVDGERVEWLSLSERLRERLAHSKQAAVFFKIADDVIYGDAVHLFDICRGAGAEVLALPGSRG
jgi:biopolymer transport protein TolR